MLIVGLKGEFDLLELNDVSRSELRLHLELVFHSLQNLIWHQLLQMLHLYIQDIDSSTSLHIF